MRVGKYLSLFVLLATVSVPALGGHTDTEHSGHFGAPPVSVDVIDAYGQPFSRYPLRARRDETRAYLEAVSGETYALRITNHSGDRVGLVVAVDGRNIISGKKSKLRAKEKMYILGPYETATYRGWRTDRDRVNEFFFTRDTDSYAGAFGDYSAMGVVAVAAYRDRHAPVPHYGKRETERRFDNHARGKSAAPNAGAHADRAEEAAPGTGFGDERYAPSYRVHFDPERRAFAKTFIKYEWRQTLCEMGIARCRGRDNRFWPREYSHSKRGYAPYPPGYRQSSREGFVRHPRYR